MHATAQGPDALDPQVDDTVYSIVVQPDQRVLIAGAFTRLGGEFSAALARQKMVRLNADGSVDSSFDPQETIGADAQVRAMVLQPDGKVVVAGASFINDRNLLRLNADGSLDTTFTSGADGTVYALALQADGGIVVGGDFSTLSDAGGGSFTREGIGRLTSTGAVDATFNPGANGIVRALLVQDDGHILVGGSFTTLGGGGTGTTTRNNIGRVDATGALDAAFNPGAGGHPSAAVWTLAIQPDGMILAGGRFTTLGGGGTGTTARNNLGRLAPSGALDTTFVPDLRQPDTCSECVIATVRSLLVLPSRQILVGGDQIALDDHREATLSLARLDADGDVDTDFYAPTDDTVWSLTRQLDGKVLLGGEFAWESFPTRFYVARIWADTPAIHKLVAFDAGSSATQGYSVSISGDGNTAIVGGPNELYDGSAWIWRRRLQPPEESGPPEVVWEREGPRLIGSDIIGGAFTSTGQAVALSADGNTAIVGGSGDNNNVGAAWIWVRSGTTWIEQAKLVGSGTTGSSPSIQGTSVALSADGDTAIVGGPGDGDDLGAAWVWTRSGGVWTQQGSKLVGTGYVGSAQQGRSVALSADGNTAMVGGPDDDAMGAAWVWTRSGGVWTQQGSKLIGSAPAMNGNQGASVALSSDGDTALVGATMDSETSGAAWVWTRSAGVWTQQGPKLVSFGALGPMFAETVRVALSGDGNTAVVGWHQDDAGIGATYVWTRTAGVWTQRSSKLFDRENAIGEAQQGSFVGASFDGSSIISGGPLDDFFNGAAWVFSTPTATTLAATAVGRTAATLNATINANGDAVTASFDYGRSASYGRSAWVSPAVGPGLTGVAASLAVSGLECGTTYHFRAVAGGEATDYGTDLTFTTLPCLPDVVTLPVATANRAPTSALLEALVNPQSASTDLFFDYGVGVYSASIPAGNVGAGMTPVAGSVTLAGLACATTYIYRARAVNEGGTALGDGLTFTTSPCAPTITIITPGNGQLTVAFAPGADGGAPITQYQHSLDGGASWITPATAVTASPLVITGLSNGVSYTVQLRAVNANHFGAPSAPVVGVPSTTPGAPTITGINPGNAQLQIAFAPGDSGGAVIGTYQYSLDGGETWNSRTPSGVGTPIVVTGLTNGVSYAVRLRAVNVNGPGDTSGTVVGTPTLAPDETTDAFNPGANGEVRNLVVQPDGKIVVGGRFTRLGGGTGTQRRNNIGRLNRDGTVDPIFDPGKDLVDPELNRLTAIVLQPDGTMVVAWDGPDPQQNRRRVGRLHANGIVDETFTSAANGTVMALARQADGKILIGGSFTALGSWVEDYLEQLPRHGIGRFNADGTLDTTFNPGTVGTVIRSLAVQQDGRILVGGSFSLIGPGGGVARHNIARLNIDGSVDPTFDPGAGGGPAPTVQALAAVNSGIFVGGRFTTLGGGGMGTSARANLGRLQVTGTLDTSFVPGPGAESASEPLPIVESLLPLPNGQILVGGYAVAVADTTRHLARLNADGSLDAGFNPDPNGRVNALAMQPDGRILVGGEFTSVGGEIRYRLARLGAPVPSRFTDDPLIPGVTPLRAAHIFELRAHITELRRRFNLGEVAWMDPTLSNVPVRTAHIQQLRDALVEAYDSALAQGLNVARPVFADDPLTPQGSVIRALHIEQLRAAVTALERP